MKAKAKQWLTLMLRDAHQPTEPPQPTVVGLQIQNSTSVRVVGFLFPEYVGALSINSVDDAGVTKWSTDVLSASQMKTLKTKGYLTNGKNEYRLLEMV